MQPQVKICPPGEYGHGHGGYKPAFDRNQFVKRAKAVSQETGISFNDFSNGMHVYRREKSRFRRLETPEWAMNQSKMREVILGFLERRYYLWKSSDSYAERLARVDKEAKRRAALLVPKLKVLQAEYTDLAKDKRTNPEYLRRVGIEVQNFDTQIVLARRGIAAVMTAVVYYYYHNGWASTQIANELGVKPPCVREWL